MQSSLLRQRTYLERGFGGMVELMSSTYRPICTALYQGGKLLATLSSKTLPDVPENHFESQWLLCRLDSRQTFSRITPRWLLQGGFRRLAGLLDPQWRGKLVTGSSQTLRRLSFTAKREFLEYVSQLKKNQPAEDIPGRELYAARGGRISNDLWSLLFYL